MVDKGQGGGGKERAGLCGGNLLFTLIVVTQIYIYDTTRQN